MDGPTVKPRRYRFPPPASPRAYAPPRDGPRTLADQAPQAAPGQAFVVLHRHDAATWGGGGALGLGSGGGGGGRRRRRRTLFTDGKDGDDIYESLPSLWDPTVTPYGTYTPQPKRRQQRGAGGRRAPASTSKANRKRPRPRSAAPSGQDSARSAYGASLPDASPARARRAQSATSASARRRRGGRGRRQLRNDGGSPLPSSPSSRAASPRGGGHSLDGGRELSLPPATEEEGQLAARRRRKKPRKKWTADTDTTLAAASARRAAALAEKRRRVRSFQATRGRRVNRDGAAVDGVVEDLAPASGDWDVVAAAEDAEVAASVAKHEGEGGHRLHRASRGAEETIAVQRLKEHAENAKRHGVVGYEEIVHRQQQQWNGGGPATTSADASMEDEEEGEEEDRRTDDDGSAYSSSDDPVEAARDGGVEVDPNDPRVYGPLCLRHLPEGRTVWPRLLRGDVPSDMLWQDLAHTIPQRVVDLSDLNVDDNLLARVFAKGSPHARRTRQLLLRRCPRLTDAGILGLDHAKALRTLDVSGCPKLTDVCFVQFAKTHAKLKHIRMTECELVTMKGVAALVAGCRRLTCIEASGGQRYTDNGLRALAKQCGGTFSANIRVLDLSGSLPDATDGSLMSVMSTMGGARTISMAGCSNMTDVSVAPLNRKSAFRNLRALDVSGSNMGDAGLSWIAHGCGEGLRELNLRGCAAITDDGIEQVRSPSPREPPFAAFWYALRGCLISSLSAPLSPFLLLQHETHY